MKTRVAIFTHESRVENLQQTLDALEAANMPVHTVSTQTVEGSGPANRKNAARALYQAFDGNPVLVLEDDVTAGRYVREWVEYLEARVHEVTCLLAMRPEFYSVDTEVQIRQPRNRRRDKPLSLTPTRLEPNPNLQHFWGSQAMWLPAWFAELVLNDERVWSDEHAPLGPWDHTIRNLLLQENRIMLTAFPGVFQHQSPPSVRQRQNKRLKLAAVFDPEGRPPKT